MSEIAFGEGRLGLPHPKETSGARLTPRQDRASQAQSTTKALQRLRAQVLTRAELASLEDGWTKAFPGQYKDYRYYEIVEETLHPEFAYGYLAVRDENDTVLTVQPYFVLDQDMLTGTNGKFKVALDLVRKFWPKFLFIRTLMFGCVAGEGHLDQRGHDLMQAGFAEALAQGAHEAAKKEQAKLIVFKEFKDHYRPVLNQLAAHGFAKVPSLPMTKLAIDFSSFDEFLETKLGRSTRKDLRRKFKATDNIPIELSISSDISAIVDEIYPLYLQVYENSQMRFEKLSREFLLELSRRMPDKMRFFVWRLNGKAIAFNMCMVSGDAVYDKYIGLDYEVAHDLHLYHYTFRDVLSWAIGNGYKWYCSTSLNYDPKYHWRMSLDPLDLYARHRYDLANFVLRRVLPLLEPTKHDINLKRFANYADLHQV